MVIRNHSNWTCFCRQGFLSQQTGLTSQYFTRMANASSELLDLICRLLVRHFICHHFRYADFQLCFHRVFFYCSLRVIIIWIWIFLGRISYFNFFIRFNYFFKDSTRRVVTEPFYYTQKKVKTRETNGAKNSWPFWEQNFCFEIRKFLSKLQKNVVTLTVVKINHFQLQTNQIRITCIKKWVKF